jgi:hypothetical protein
MRSDEAEADLAAARAIGSGQYPRNAASNRRPLWKDLPDEDARA